MDFKIIYEDDDILVIDKPAGIIVFHEEKNNDGERSRTVADLLIEKYPKLADVGLPPRYGVVHRLDKDTSGVLLVAKNNEALIFLQKQFSAGAKALVGTQEFSAGQKFPSSDKKNIETLEKTLEKRYIALVTGVIKEDSGTIQTLIGRSPADPRKQKVYPVSEVKSSKLKVQREAITEYKVLQRFEDYTLLEVKIKTGRKHQIRCHMAYIHHPIAGDKLYGFKDSPIPKDLNRQFLHASYLKIKLPVSAGRPSGDIKEFHSELPEDLKEVIIRIQSE